MGRALLLILLAGYLQGTSFANEQARLSLINRQTSIQDTCKRVEVAADPILAPIPFPQSAEDLDPLKIAKTWQVALMAKQKGDLVEFLPPFTNPEKAVTSTIYGVPREAKWITEGRIFRHYTESQATVDEIYRVGGLNNSFVNYEQIAPGVYRKIYPDLTGIFLTDPQQVVPMQVGVESKFYVDVRVPDGVPVLELEKGNIYVIPMPSRMRDWVKVKYLDYLNGDMPPDSQYFKMCQKIQARGGITPDLMMPLEIVDSGSIGP